MPDGFQNKYSELGGLTVRVDDVVYMPSLDAPSEKPHPFVYFITIENGSNERVTITGRKWIVRERKGEVIVVEGDGLVGLNPVLEPGEDFSYNSYHITACDAEVRGAFFGLTDTGKSIKVLIPQFRLELPDWA